MKEIWKDIKGFEGKYQISNTGKVRSLSYLKTKEIRELAICERAAYCMVHLSKNGHVYTKRIYQLVAKAFIENPQNKPCVNHKDGNKHNNCVDNLEWVTHLENNLHAFRILGKWKDIKFDKHWRSKKVEQHYISEDGHDYCLAVYANVQIAAKINGLCANSIYECCHNDKNHKNVGGYRWRFKETIQEL